MLFAATHAARTRSLTLVGTACDLFPIGEPGSDTVRQHLAILDREGAEAAFDQRPPGVEVTFGELWDEAEARARGIVDEYYAQQHAWRTRVHQLPREQRVHYYTTELRNMGAYMQVDVCAYAASLCCATITNVGVWPHEKSLPLHNRCLTKERLFRKDRALGKFYTLSVDALRLL